MRRNVVSGKQARAARGDEPDAEDEGEGEGDAAGEEEEEEEEEGEGDAEGDDAAQEVTVLEEEPKKKKKKKPKPHPQDIIKKLWSNYDPEYHGKITQILPDAVPTTTKLPTKPKISENAADSYKEARMRCEHAVKMIIAECIATNQKYTDPHFDLERDLKLTQARNCLNGLTGENEFSPSDVKRVTVR